MGKQDNRYEVEQTNSGLYVAKAKVISAWATNDKGELLAGLDPANRNAEGSVICLSKAEYRHLDEEAR